MQNQDDNSLELDDDFYDDTLDEAFEEESFGADELDNDFDDSSLDAEYGGLEEFGDGAESQEWDDTEFDDSLVKKEKSGSGLSFNTIAIIGAVIVGGGIFAFQVTTKKPTQIVDRFTSALNLSGATDGPIFGGEEEQTKEPEVEITDTTLNLDTEEQVEINGEAGFLFEPDMLDDIELQLNDAPPMPTPISGDIVNGMGVEEKAAAILNSKPAVKVSEVAETPRSPEPKTVEVLEQIAETPIIGQVVEVKEDSPVSVEEVKKTEVIHKPIAKTTNLQPLEQKLDMIVNRLDDMEVKINQIQGVSDSKIDALKQEVNKLQKISNSSTAKKSKLKKTKASPVKRSTKKVIPAPIAWELRAAQPNKAWVSHKVKNDMRSVIVGDNLPGIGRVSAISLINGRWVIKGSTGEIHQ